MSLKKVLRVEIPIRSHSLIQVLLLLELAFSLNIFLLKLAYNIIIQLYLFEALIIFSIGLGSLETILLFVRL